MRDHEGAGRPAGPRLGLSRSCRDPAALAGYDRLEMNTKSNRQAASERGGRTSKSRCGAFFPKLSAVLLQNAWGFFAAATDDLTVTSRLLAAGVRASSAQNRPRRDPL